MQQTRSGHSRWRPSLLILVFDGLSAVHRLSRVAGLALSLMLLGSPLSAEAGGEFRGIDGLVWCGLCGGSWSVSITPVGRLQVKVAGEADTTKQLAPQELAQLRKLLQALPSSAKRFSFGEYYVDATTVYELKVGAPGGGRAYYISSDLRPEERRLPAVAAINDVWRYLRTLFNSEKALALIEDPFAASVKP